MAIIFRDGLTVDTNTGRILAVGNPNNLPVNQLTSPTQNTTQNINQNTNQSNGHTVLFSAYGRTIYNDATISQITAPDGTSRQAVKWTNPDGSYVWETVDGSNVQNYASQYYKAPANQPTPKVNSDYQNAYDQAYKSAKTGTSIEQVGINPNQSEYSRGVLDAYKAAGWTIGNQTSNYFVATPPKNSSSATTPTPTPTLTPTPISNDNGWVFRNGITVDPTGRIIGVGDLTGNQSTTPSTEQWVDPANGSPTARGIGMLKSEWDKQQGTVAPTPPPTPTPTSNLTLNSLLADPRVQADQGVNGTTMTKWLNGNASLIPQLAARGYTIDDLVNEAYSQVHYNRSAFSGDMTTTTRTNNTPATSNTPPTPPPTPTPPATTKATLSSPDGKYKVEVTAGSSEASRLQSSGWKVGATGTTAIDLNTALGTITTNPVDTPTTSTTLDDKIIYKKGADLYIKNGNIFYKIPDQKTLEDLVFNKGYKDTRTDVPVNAEIGGINATPPTGTTGDTTDKKIYKKDSDLYIKTGDKYYKIPDPATLYDLVTNKGYQDVRENLSADAPIGNFSDQPAAPANTYDPIAEAAKYGYTREDFANDPGFEAYWKTKTPEQLVAQLKLRKDYDTTSGKKKVVAGTITDTKTGVKTDLTSEQKLAIDKLNTDIDAMTLSIEEKAILKQIASQDFTSGNKIPSTQELQNIIQTASQNAEADLAPYYEKTSARELEDMKNKMADIRTNVANYTATETAGYKKTLADTRASLRSRGLTFSGTSTAQLGNEGANINPNGIEGTIPAARRLDYAAKTTDLASQARDIGIAGERKLGSAAVGGLDVATPYGNTNLYNPKALGQEGYVTTGDIALDKIKEKEKSLWSRVAKYRSTI